VNAPANANLYALFASRFRGRRARTCIETPDGARWSYADVERESARYAALLGAGGAAPGERVVARVPKSPEALVLYLACLRAGLVYVPLHPAGTRAELEHHLSDAAPAVVVCAPEAESETAAVARRAGVRRVLTLGPGGEGSLSEPLPDEAAPVVAERAAGDLAAILYTSGTTGRAKGAMLSHGNLTSNALALHRSWGFAAGDVLLHALPLFHTHGLFVACHCALLNASPLILLPRFDPEAVIERLRRATVFMGVPTHYVRLLASPALTAACCRGVRLFISGSAPLGPETFDAFRERTGHTLLERYGMTECGMITSNPLAGPRRRGTVGRPLPGVEVRVAGEGGRRLPVGRPGTIEVRGPNVCRGYWRDAEKTARAFSEDGWFRTGDLGVVDEEGYVSVVGRQSDLVISGGYNVYPKEVEQAIDALEGIAESAVIGVPDTDLGERVTAVVAMRPGAAPPAPGVVRDALRSRLAGYKVPKQVEYVDALPRNAMGKVQRHLLRQRFAPGHRWGATAGVGPSYLFEIIRLQTQTGSYSRR